MRKPLIDWMENGGTLVRFASSRLLSAGNDDIGIIKKMFEALPLVSDGTGSSCDQDIDVALVKVPVQCFGV